MPPKIGADMPSASDAPAVPSLPNRAKFDPSTGAVLPSIHTAEVRHENMDGSFRIVGLIREDK